MNFSCTCVCVTAYVKNSAMQAYSVNSVRALLPHLSGLHGGYVNDALLVRAE